MGTERSSEGSGPEPERSRMDCAGESDAGAEMCPGPADSSLAAELLSSRACTSVSSRAVGLEEEERRDHGIFGRDLARLVLAYPQVDTATRETLAIHAFLDSLAGPAIEMRLHVIKGRPRTMLHVTGARTGYGGKVRKIEEDNPPQQLCKDLRDLGEAAKKLEQRFREETAASRGPLQETKKSQAEFGEREQRVRETTMRG